MTPGGVKEGTVAPSARLTQDISELGYFGLGPAVLIWL